MNRREFIDQNSPWLERLLMISVRERFVLLYKLDLFPEYENGVSRVNLEGSPSSVALGILMDVDRMYGDNQTKYQEVTQKIHAQPLPEGIPAPTIKSY